MVSVRVEVDPPRWYGRWQDVEGYERYLKDWAKKLKEFVRDHRSQEQINLEVVGEYEDRCAFCDYVWEEGDDGCPTCCAEAVQEWETANAEAKP
jgi:hypothetical protein